MSAPMPSFILGAEDPEMVRIERILDGAGAPTYYAQVKGEDGAWRRVRPAEAYRDPVVRWPDPQSPDERVVLVECRPALPHGVTVAVVADHHNPGDPGFGVAPERFLAASALGQVLRILPQEACTWPLLGAEPLDGEPVADGFVFRDGTWYLQARFGGDGAAFESPVDDDLVLAAAADHCPWHAYQGMCPGVDPEALAAWRLAERAAFQRVPAALIEERVRRARDFLEQARDFGVARAGTVEGVLERLDGCAYVKVLGGTLRELPEAALQAGVAFEALLEVRGERRLVLQSAPAELVAAWLRRQEAAGRRTYGDPARGFAGAYL